MDIRITKTALEELGKISADKLRIFVQGYG
jgi:hypothetical protein